MAKMSKEDVKKFAEALNEMNPKDQKELMESLGLDVDIDTEIERLQKIQKNNPEKDDRFFLFKWIEDYGCYLGTAALLIIVFTWLFRKNGSSSTEMYENVSAISSLISGK